MAEKKDQIKSPRVLKVQFATQEYEEYEEFARREGGSLGPFARALLLKAARASKAKAEA